MRKTKINSPEFVSQIAMDKLSPILLLGRRRDKQQKAKYDMVVDNVVSFLKGSLKI